MIMNKIKLKLNPYDSSLNNISKNGQPISRYSDFNNYMHEPFLTWADNFFTTALEEFNDTFLVEIVSHEFEQIILKNLKKEFKYCEYIHVQSFENNAPIQERVVQLGLLQEKYNLPLSLREYAIAVFSVNDSFDRDEIINVSNQEDAFLLILNDKKEISRAILNNDKEQIIVILSEKEHLSILSENKYLWEVPENLFDSYFTLIIDRFVYIPYITAAVSKLQSFTSFDNNDYNTLLRITEIDNQIDVDIDSDIEINTVSIPVFHAKNEMDYSPKLRLESSNTNVVQIHDNLKLFANSVGLAVISVFRYDETKPFYTKTVNVYRDNSIRTIEIIPSQNVIAIDDILTLDINCYPMDSDNLSDLKIEVDNNCLEVISLNELKAVSAGTANITLYTATVQSSVNITVLPDVSDIKIKAAQSTLYVGECTTVEVELTPKSAFNTDYILESSDSRVAVPEKNKEGQDIIRATGIGTCQIICKAKKGSAQESTTLTIKSIFDKKENKHTFLSISFILLFAAVVFSFVLPDVNRTIFYCLSALSGFIAFGKNKSDRIWAIVLITVSIFLFVSEKTLL